MLVFHHSMNFCFFSSLKYQFSSRSNMHGALQVVVGSSNFSFQLWWEVTPCFWLVVPRRCSSEHGEMDVRANMMGGSRTSTRVGKKVQPLHSIDMDVSCSNTKEKTGEATTVEKATKWGIL